jgi:hypothetical protein
MKTKFLVLESVALPHFPKLSSGFDSIHDPEDPGSMKTKIKFWA